MKKLIEVHLFLNRSTTHPITPEERIKHVMQEMVKTGHVLGYWTTPDMVGITKGVHKAPDFKVVNIDWRNEKAMIEPITEFPGWDLDTVLLSIATKTEWSRAEGYKAVGIYGMYFFLGDATAKETINHSHHQS